MIFPHHGCADNNFITFLYKLFILLYPVYDNSKLILLIHLLDKNFRNFDRHVLYLTFAIHFQLGKAASENENVVCILYRKNISAILNFWILVSENQNFCVEI